MQISAERDQALDHGGETVSRGFDGLPDENSDMAFCAELVAEGIAALAMRRDQHKISAALRADLAAAERNAQAKRRAETS